MFRGPFPRQLLAAALLLCVSAPAQNARDLKLADYQERKEGALFDAGQRHLQLGSWARKVGLVPQATTQFLSAVEVADGKNQGAVTVLAYMRGLGEAFWKGERKRPSKTLLSQYQKRAEDVAQDDRKARLDLMQRAVACDLLDDARSHCRAALALGCKLEFDAKGRARLDGTVLPDALASWLEQQTATVNGTERRFEAAGDRAPRLPDVREHRSDRVVVRTDLSGEMALRLHELATALLPHLQERLDGGPTRPLSLFVFARRDDYVAYLKAVGMESHAFASGLADAGTFQTLVCAEGLPEEDVQALTLHELTHLFWYGTAPAAMPDWYAEGLAESFGGQGTFTWDGKKLEVGGLMRRDRIDEVKKAPFPLRELLDGDASRLLSTDKGAGMRFYAQSWALMRYLTEDRSPWRERFEQWEANCRGAVLGAVPGRVQGDGMPARALWDRLFGKDVEHMEAGFREWLGRL